MENKSIHNSVLLEEVLSFLKPIEEGSEPQVFLDGTLGGGGHSYALLEQNRGILLVGFDRDKAAIDRTSKRLETFAGRFFLQHGSFGDLEEMLVEVGCNASSAFGQTGFQFSGILLDLGISSDQLDDLDRGFSFKSGPLDMRMDQEQKRSASTVVNEYSFAALRRVFLRGDLGSKSSSLARKIVDARPIETNKELADICQSVLGRNDSKPGRHPATIAFQAIRIEVNTEFEELERFLEQVPNYLVPGGRLAIISFHSLEDKMAARFMRDWSREKRPLPELAQADVPAMGRLLTKSAITPSEQEKESNPRARSARMRIFEYSLDTRPR